MVLFEAVIMTAVFVGIGTIVPFVVDKKVR